MPRNPYWEFIQANPDKGWFYDRLSSNPNITWEIVQANPDKSWFYNYLSFNPSITWEIVRANSDKDWNYYCLSINPNITWEIVQANPDKPWYYNALLYNPNITPKIIMENINMFPDISHFQDNKLNYHPYFHSALYKRKMTAQIHAAIYCELIARACTPARLFQWNEGAAEQFPTEYLQECVKYS